LAAASGLRMEIKPTPKALIGLGAAHMLRVISGMATSNSGGFLTG
jgi:hypothetical protein